jgi:hypothetical protein
MRILTIIVAAGAMAAATSAEAQRRSEADYSQGLQQSALAFAAQNQWRGGFDPSNRYIGGRRQAGRMYDEPPFEGWYEMRPAPGRRYIYR